MSLYGMVMFINFRTIIEIIKFHHYYIISQGISYITDTLNVNFDLEIISYRYHLYLRFVQIEF